MFGISLNWISFLRSVCPAPTVHELFNALSTCIFRAVFPLLSRLKNRAGDPRVRPRWFRCWTLAKSILSPTRTSDIAEKSPFDGAIWSKNHSCCRLSALGRDCVLVLLFFPLSKEKWCVIGVWRTTVTRQNGSKTTLRSKTDCNWRTGGKVVFCPAIPAT